MDTPAPNQNLAEGHVAPGYKAQARSNNLIGTKHEAAHPWNVRDLLEKVPHKASFIDLGSGEGNACAIAQSMGFSPVVGYEIDPLLVAMSWMLHPKLKFVHGNARDFTPLRWDSTVFMFNPFGRETMEHIERNCRRPGMHVAYLNSVHADLFDNWRVVYAGHKRHLFVWGV